MEQLSSYTSPADQSSAQVSGQTAPVLHPSARVSAQALAAASTSSQEVSYVISERFSAMSEKMAEQFAHF